MFVCCASAAPNNRAACVNLPVATAIVASSVSMALIDLWISATESIRDKHIQQIISFAGSGRLVDESKTSTEFRAYLSHVPSDLLARYANECLVSSFDQSGLALQDIVNQIGQRLSFNVQDGSYRGKRDIVGFDGVWRSERGDDIVVEVKTTDAYRIDLNTLANYRQHLIKNGQIAEHRSSILIIVGREDTGDLEAQIRGARYAWEIRLISVESLIRLMILKESIEDPRVMYKICTILTPQEYTKVDGIIDLVFSTAEDINTLSTNVTTERSDAIPAIPLIEAETNQTPRAALFEESSAGSDGDRRHQSILRDQCINKVSSHLQTTLVKISRSTYQSPDKITAISCAISREYSNESRVWYWFAFHPYQQTHLRTAQKAYAVFGCGDQQHIFAIPLKYFESCLGMLNTTTKDSRSYWHIQIERTSRQWMLLCRTGFEHIDITEYQI